SPDAAALGLRLQRNPAPGRANQGGLVPGPEPVRTPRRPGAQAGVLGQRLHGERAHRAAAGHGRACPGRADPRQCRRPGRSGPDGPLRAGAGRPVLQPVAPAGGVGELPSAQERRPVSRPDDPARGHGKPHRGGARALCRRGAVLQPHDPPVSHPDHSARVRLSAQGPVRPGQGRHRHAGPRGEVRPASGAGQMNFRRMLAQAVLALGMLGGAVPAPAAAAAPDTAGQVAVPAWTGPVMDEAGALTADQVRTLTAQVQALERQHGSQLFVLLVPTTGNESIEQYARRVFDQWAVGRKNIDDGVLLLVAVQDRRLRIEVGYGLEGAVTDVDAGRIIRERITPRFAAGDLFGGVEAGVSALTGLIQGDPLPPPESTDDDEGLDERVMFLPLTFFALIMTPPIGALLLGGFVFVLTESLRWTAVAALAGLALGILGRILHIPDQLARGRGAQTGGRGGGG